MPAAGVEIETTAIRTRWMTVALWGAQLALAAVYGMAGGMHLLVSPDAMAGMGIAWALESPIWLVRLIGLAEVAGAVGIVLPALTRILPWLTPLAAIGLAAIQALAVPFHIVRDEFAPLPFNLLLFALCLPVVWGRMGTDPSPGRQ